LGGGHPASFSECGGTIGRIATKKASFILRKMLNGL
jgi:hypothetical protein